MHTIIGELVATKLGGEKVISSYKKALIQVPEFAESYHNLSVSLAEASKTKDAIRTCYRAIILRPRLFLRTKYPWNTAAYYR